MQFANLCGLICACLLASNGIFCGKSGSGCEANCINNKDTVVALVTSLEQLYSLPPKGTVVEKCDLSYHGITEMPVLKLYNIKRLDMSHNELRIECGTYNLPPSLSEADFSYCNIGVVMDEHYYSNRYYKHLPPIAPLEYFVSNMYFRAHDFPNLKYLNVSYNRIGTLRTPKHTKVEKQCYDNGAGVVNEVRVHENCNDNGIFVGGNYMNKVKLVRSLDELYSLPPGTTVIETCDLSNQGLVKLPVLRPYNIQRLNLSGNDFGNEIVVGFRELLLTLPASLVELDMSSCHLGKRQRELDGKRNDVRKLDFTFGKEDFPRLRVVDLSGNCFSELFFSQDSMKRIDVSANGLDALGVATEKLEYLNVSDNWEMSRQLGSVNVEKTDTLLHDNCARGEKLGGIHISM